MTTGIGRFILLSAALHLAVLTALGYSAARPMEFRPAVLSVTFRNGPAGDMREIPYHNNARPAPPITDARSNAEHIEDPMPSSPVTTAVQEAGRDAPASPISPARSEVHDSEGENTSGDAITPRATRQGEAPVANVQTQDHMAARIATAPSLSMDMTLLTSRLEGQLRDALAPYFVYPMMARRNGWQGQVQLELRVEADGHLSHVRIAHSSGYRLLDHAALATLNRIKSVPKAAGWLDGRHFDIVLPVDYRLIGGQS